MKVLMFGWEFPPLSSGGLGTACYGLTKGLNTQGVEVTFVLPYLPEDAKAEFVNLIPASLRRRNKLRIIQVDSLLTAYVDSQSYATTLSHFRSREDPKNRKLYGADLFQEVDRLAMHAKELALQEDFDVIHCHDWMTFPAGIAAKHASGKPLIVHVHATEFDRTGGNVNQMVYDVERYGMHEADLIIAVSQYTKNKIVEHYGIAPEKVVVVHNAIDPGVQDYSHEFRLSKQNKIVLFLGRITLQKGPDYFIEAAKRCLDLDPSLRFVIAGTGDMEGRLIERAASLGIGDKVLFAGFITGPNLDRLYQMADVYVMPSVSEPFGITPLEAIKNGTPVIVSRQSGVSEVLTHCLKVDFWDINQLVNKILAVVHHHELSSALREHGALEIQKFSWNTPAQKCVDAYHKVGVW